MMNSNNQKYRNGGIAQYMYGGDVQSYADGGFNNPMDEVNAIREKQLLQIQQNLNLPDTLPEAGSNILDPNFKFEADLSVDYGKGMKDYDFDRSSYENYMEATRTPEDDARDDLEEEVNKNKEKEEELTFKEKMGKLGELLDVPGASKDGTSKSSLVGKIYSFNRGASRVPKTRRFEDGGIASLMPMGMDDGGFATGFGFNFQDGYEDVSMTDEERDEYEEAVRRYNEAQDDPDAYNESINPTITYNDAVARGYGARQGDRIDEGFNPSKMNFVGTEPGQEIEIDARDETPAAYRFYGSPVSKLYSQMKGVPFSPLVAPPREATYVDSLQPRRIQSQLYAKDGTYVNAYADGSGRYGIQQLAPEEFPRRQELITGPGGERGDEIPAMLSDGEFVTNSAAVRGMGIMAGANPEDEYEQRLLGARQMYDYQKQAEEMAKRYA